MPMVLEVATSIGGAMGCGVTSGAGGGVWKRGDRGFL